jgi:dienelactone hydrolase
MAKLAALLATATLACAAGRVSPYSRDAAPLRFRVDDALELSGHLYRPEGAGPFPAVVLMHGCGGPTWQQDRAAIALRDSGYVALSVDSFSTRGVSEVCSSAGRRPRPSPTAWDRVEDALAARRFLSSLPFVDADRIGLVGWSHGGFTALLTWARDQAVPGRGPFAAVVAWYPYCPAGDLAAGGPPLLILIGDRDDWTPSPRCESYLVRATAAGRTASLKIYPGATHAFDREGRDAEYLGHRLVRDPEATRDARRRLLEFLASTLRAEGRPPAAAP